MRGARQVAAERLWWAWSASLTATWDDAAAVVLADLVAERAEAEVFGPVAARGALAEVEDGARALINELSASSPEHAATIVRHTAGR